MFIFLFGKCVFPSIKYGIHIFLISARYYWIHWLYVISELVLFQTPTHVPVVCASATSGLLVASETLNTTRPTRTTQGKCAAPHTAGTILLVDNKRHLKPYHVIYVYAYKRVNKLSNLRNHVRSEDHGIPLARPSLIRCTPTPFLLNCRFIRTCGLEPV